MQLQFYFRSQELMPLISESSYSKKNIGHAAVGVEIRKILFNRFNKKFIFAWALVKLFQSCVSSA